MTARKLPLLLLILIAPLSSLARSQSTMDDVKDIIFRSKAVRNIEDLPRSEPPKKPTLSKEAEAALAPPDDLKLAYKNFLKQKNTGLIRLLPRKEKIEGMLVSAENPTTYIPFRYGGSSYSFSNRKYGDDFVVPELRFEINTYLCNNHSSGNAFLMASHIGFITRLGDVALEDVTLDRKEARFLVDLKAPILESAAQENAKMSSSGFETNGVFYKWCAPAENNTTYLARAIEYGNADLLVAFRTVREEPNGSIVILWKILKKNPITFPK